MATVSRFSAIYAFGDSLNDAGNDWIGTAGNIPVSPPYFQQNYGLLNLPASLFSNGPIWAQDLSSQLGLGKLAPSLYAGNDFAYGGSEANPSGSGISGFGAQVIGLDSQLTQFDAAGGGSSSGLYTLSIGTNDIIPIVENAAFDLGAMVGRIAAAAAAEVSFVSSLVDRGARAFLVIDVPDVSKMPVVAHHDSAATIALASQMSNLYNVDLNAGLQGLAQSRGVSIDVMPLYSLTEEIVANPARFGISNVTDPAWTGNFTDPNSGTLAADPNSHLFWDEYHPTAAVHQLIADDAASIVTTGTPLFTVPTVQMTDTVTGQSSTQFGTIAKSPVTTLAGQFIYPGLDSVALSTTAPSMFLKGGPGADALQVTSGNNVLDGGGGSNFLVGGTGSDVFFVDGRAGAPAWSTISNFQPGDSATVFGFHPGLSTLPFTAAEGAAGYQGLTIHSELNGPGTGVLASLTFAGIDPLTAYDHFTVTGGTLSAGTADATDYLLIQYNR